MKRSLLPLAVASFVAGFSATILVLNIPHSDNAPLTSAAMRVLNAAALIAASPDNLGLGQVQLREVFETAEETCLGWDKTAPKADPYVCQYFEMADE
jgi:hypothetical protein